MQVIIRMSKKAEAKALPILLRHSPGTVLENQTYIIDESAVEMLRKAKIEFTELGRNPVGWNMEGVGVGERI